MAKPTEEEIKKQIKRLEAEMLGGYVPPSVYKDLLGVPKLSQEALYLQTPYPVGLPLGTSGGTPLKQTTLDELTDLELALEEEQMKRLGQAFGEEERKARRQEIYQVNYDDYLKPALSSTFGGMKEKAKEAPAFLGVPVKQAPTMSEEGEPSILTPFQVQSKSIDTEIDWKGFKQSLIDEGKDPEEAQGVINDTRRSLDAYLSIYPNKTPAEAYEGLMDEMKAIENAPKIEKPKLEGFEKTEGAFGRQVTEADMPANLTPEQMELAKKMIELNQEKVYAETKAMNLDKKVPHIRVTVDPATGASLDVPKSVYQAIMSGNPKLPNYEPFINEQVDNTIRNGLAGGEKQLALSTATNPQQALETYAKAEAILKAGDPKAWYLNPEAKKAVMENPEKYVQEGFFTDTSPFGDVAETGGAYGFRMIMSPLNAIAGGLQPVLEAGVGGTMGVVAEAGEAVGLLPEADYFDPFALSRKRAEQRAEDTPLYADNPILANIALNKGFTGEAEDISKALNLEGWAKGAVIGGGFLTDIASPDVGMLLAAGKALKVGAPVIGEAVRANKAMFGTSEGAIRQALKAGGSTFMNDLNGVSAILSKTKGGKALKEARHGSVASHLGDTTAEVLYAQRLVNDADNLNAAKGAVITLPPAHPYRKAVETATDLEGVKAIDPMEVAKQTEPTNVRLLEEHKATQRALNEVAGGRTLQEAKGLSKANSDLINNVSVARYGEKLENLSSAERLSIIGDTARVIDNNYAKAVTLNTLGPKGLAQLDNIFALTAKTWAHENQAPKIIAEANKTKLGELLRTIRGEAKVASQRPTAGGVPFFRRQPSTTAEVIEGYEELGIQRVFRVDGVLEEKVNNLLRETDIPELLRERVRTEGASGVMSFDTFRALTDYNIDSTAKGMGGAFGAEDLSRLTPEEQTRLLAGKLQTGIIGKGWRKLTGQVFKDTNKTIGEAKTPLTSVPLKQAHKNILQQASGMDKKLRPLLDDLMKNEDDALRQLYDIKETGPLSVDQALGYAIVGPAALRGEVGSIADVSDWAMSRIFFTNEAKVSFMDRVTGRAQIVSNDLLSATGRREWGGVVEDFQQDIIKGNISPAEFLPEFNRLIDEYVAILQQGQNLRFGVTQSDIVSKVDKAKGGLKEQLSIGMYYNAEGSRIVFGELMKLAEADIIKTNTTQILGVRGARRAESILGSAAVVDQTFETLTKLLIGRNFNDRPNLSRLLNSVAKNDPVLGPVIGTGGLATATFTPAQQARLSVLNDIMNKADETSNIILDNLQLNSSRLPTSVNGIEDIKDLFKTEEGRWRLMLGNDTYEDFMQVAEEGRLQKLTAQLDGLFRETRADVAWRTIDGLVAGVNTFFYDLLLSWRPRFHGGNTSTAAAIVYQTTGRVLTPSQVNKGRRLAFSANDLSGRYTHEIAVIDNAGRPYTYGELSNILQTSGVRSEYDFVTQALGNDQLLAYVKRHNGKGYGLGEEGLGWLSNAIAASKRPYKAPTEALGDLVMKEDLVFRGGVMIQALEEGKSLDAAVLEARRSLFDYNDMSPAEKAFASRYFVFYAFQRQNFMSFVEALGDGAKMKRFINTYKFKRGTEIATINANENKRFDDRFFFDDKFINRMVLGMQQREEDIVAYASAPIPALDAPVQFFNLLYHPLDFASDTITGTLRPSIARWLKTKSKFDREYYRVPPEFIVGAGVTFDNPEQIAKFYQDIVGGTIIPREGTPAEGAVDGFVYPMDEKQREKFKAYVNLINTTGAISMYQDWFKMFSGEGTAYEEVPAAAVPFTTPMKLTEKDRIEYYNLQARQRALEAELKEKERELRKQRGQ